MIPNTRCVFQRDYFHSQVIEDMKFNISLSTQERDDIARSVKDLSPPVHLGARSFKLIIYIC